MNNPHITTTSMIKPNPLSLKNLSGLRDVSLTPGSTLFVTSIAIILPLLLLASLRRYAKMREARRKPFPFLKLPRELRDMVYEQLLENPQYPAPPRSQQTRSSISRMIPSRPSFAPAASQHAHKSNWVFLANKQIHTEYMDMLYKRATFHLTVTPQNCEPSSFDPSTPKPTEDTRIFKISKETLKNLRSCSLKLVTTSSMLGVPDPRDMTSSSWPLARQIREELKYIENVTSLTLPVKAIGDPLWNPLWVWYHASQSFKSMGTELSDTVPIGPRLNRITFSLDTWSPGENYLQRDEECEGRWTWYCMEGHTVGLDIGPEMTVRQFCGKLYEVCKVCRPDL